MRVGILAIQGDIQAHSKALARLNVDTLHVLSERDLELVDALILPGGESTTISKGLERLSLYAPLRTRIDAGLPVLGTCAGAILLCRDVENHPVPVIGRLSATASRNAYGTQVDSFASVVDAGAKLKFEGMRCVFIRAPKLHTLDAHIEVLAQVNSEPVLVREGNVFAATFHPELTEDTRVHQLLVDAAA